MTYLNRPRSAWPTTDRRIAAALRRDLQLPELQVTLRGGIINVRWTDGPRNGPVAAELREALRSRLPVRTTRVYRPATFGAALLAPENRLLVGWKRGEAAWQDLDGRDLDAEPLSEELMVLGHFLAGITEVKSGARLGYHRYRWDWWMCCKLAQIGDTVLLNAAS